MYGGIQARLLTVLTSPGTATRAAPRGTGFLCIEDPDPAAANIKNLLEHAGVRPVDMVPWNACPWFTREQKPTTAELEAGVDPWLRLMALVPALRVIMLLGGAAEKAGGGFCCAVQTWRHALTLRSSAPTARAGRSPAPRSLSPRGSATRHPRVLPEGCGGDQVARPGAALTCALRAT
jgi:uracil-DNA glycosylase